MSSSEYDEEELDPRIEVELDRLNSSSENVNRLEKELEDIQKAFVEMSRDAGGQLSSFQKRLGSSVDRARPYYQLKATLDKAQTELHARTQEYEKYIVGFQAAEEMLLASEERRSATPVSQTCQIMVDVSKKKVANLAEQLAHSKKAHNAKCMQVADLNEQLQKLKRDNNRSIVKAKPYFDQYEDMCSRLERKKADLNSVTRQLAESKRTYSGALAALESISNEIHLVRSRLPSLNAGSPLKLADTPEAEAQPSPPDRHEKGLGVGAMQDFDVPIDVPATTARNCAASADEVAMATSVSLHSKLGMGARKHRAMLKAAALCHMSAGRLRSLDFPVEVVESPSLPNGPKISLSHSLSAAASVPYMTSALGSDCSVPYNAESSSRSGLSKSAPRPLNEPAPVDSAKTSQKLLSCQSQASMLSGNSGDCSSGEARQIDANCSQASLLSDHSNM